MSIVETPYKSAAARLSRRPSEENLAIVAEHGDVAINQVIYDEVAVGFATREQLERALQGAGLARISVPWSASWLVDRPQRANAMTGNSHGPN